MKNVQSLVLVALTVLFSVVSCAPETINNDEQLKFQFIEKGKVETPTTKS